MVIASASPLSGSVMRTLSGGEGLPKVCCRRTLRFGHLCSQCSRVCGSSLHSERVRSSAESSKWAYALRIGVCPIHGRARRTASALLKVVMQSAFQEKYSYTMAVRGKLDGGSVIVRERGRGGVSMAVAAAFVNSSVASLPYVFKSRNPC